MGKLNTRAALGMTLYGHARPVGFPRVVQHSFAAMSTAEKGITYESEHARPRSSDATRRGSIYQVIPPSERRMSAQGRRISVVDDIFGEIKEGGPNYRNVSPLWLLGHAC